VNQNRTAFKLSVCARHSCMRVLSSSRLTYTGLPLLLLLVPPVVLLLLLLAHTRQLLEAQHPRAMGGGNAVAGAERSQECARWSTQAAEGCAQADERGMRSRLIADITSKRRELRSMHGCQRHTVITVVPVTVSNNMPVESIIAYRLHLLMPDSLAVVSCATAANRPIANRAI
jgi:hypothetical protein